MLVASAAALWAAVCLPSHRGRSLPSWEEELWAQLSCRSGVPKPRGTLNLSNSVPLSSKPLPPAKWQVRELSLFAGFSFFARGREPTSGRLFMGLPS